MGMTRLRQKTRQGRVVDGRLIMQVLCMSTRILHRDTLQLTYAPENEEVHRIRQIGSLESLFNILPFVSVPSKRPFIKGGLLPHIIDDRTASEKMLPDRPIINLLFIVQTRPPVTTLPLFLSTRTIHLGLRGLSRSSDKILHHVDVAVF